MKSRPLAYREKLGWLTTFQEDIPRWRACQAVVSASITFVNKQGLFRGAADRLAARTKVTANVAMTAEEQSANNL